MARSRIPSKLRHPGAEPGCGVCRGSGTVVLPGGEVAVAQACACVGTCPSCHGTGLVATSDKFRARQRRCVCRIVQARWGAFNVAGVPARHADSSLVSFKPKGSQTQVLASVSSYLSGFDPTTENRGLVLFGEVGRGKTHLLVALVQDLVFRHGVRVKFVEFSHLLADLKTGFDVGRGMAALIDPLVEVEVLAIDELGKGRNTDFEGTVLDELVSRRYNAMRPILATTNFRPGRTGRPTGNMADPSKVVGLADRVGDRVYSRLMETCDFVEVPGEDYRKRSARQRR